MTAPLYLGRGAAPNVTILDGLVYLAAPLAERMILTIYTPDGVLVREPLPLPDTYEQSYPIWVGPWLTYKTFRNQGVGCAAVNVQTGEVRQFPIAPDGIWPFAPGDDSSFFVQTKRGDPYVIFHVSFGDNSITETPFTGAPDGIDARHGQPVCRKDIANEDPAVGGFPARAGDLAVGQYAYSLGTRLDGQPVRVILGQPGDEHESPRPAAAGELYAVTCAGPPGIRLWILSRTDLATLPIPVPPVDPIVRIGRPLWFGWFVGRPGADAAGWETTADPRSLPGSFVLVIPDGTVIATARGDVVAGYAQGASDSDSASIEAAIVNARKAHPGVPILAYWPRQAWAQVPSSEWVGVEAYRLREESVEAFEARVRGAVARVSKAVLIAQCYTSNTNNTTDLASIPPVIARIARDYPNVVGILIFNGTGRATGLQDHPELREPWRQVFAGITGPPAIDPPHPPPPSPPPAPPPPPPAAVWFTRSKEFRPMSTKPVALRLGEFFARIDPHEAGKGPFGFYPVRFDRRDAGDANCRFLLSKPDDRLQLQHEATSSLLGADATEYGTNICSQFYGKPTDRGGYESWNGWQIGNGINVVLIQYDRESGRYASACLTVVEL